MELLDEEVCRLLYLLLLVTLRILIYSYYYRSCRFTELKEDLSKAFMISAVSVVETAPATAETAEPRDVTSGRSEDTAPAAEQPPPPQRTAR